MAQKAITRLDLAGVDAAVLAAAGLQPGQTVVAEATEAGLLLRPATNTELADARRLVPDEIRGVLRRYPGTIDRLRPRR